MPFLNRTDELALLGRRLSAPRSEFLVVYGRRRVGKTELLTHVGSSIRTLYYEATDSVVTDQLADLTAQLARTSGDELLEAQSLTSWDAVLAAIAQFVGSERTLVVLDEFQYLARKSPQLETLLSRWWRTTGSKLPIVLVLAGSELSFFEDEVLAGKLYGRRSGQLKVLPFMARDAAQFHPRYSPEDRVRAYSICGGIPYYLDRFRDDAPLAEHLLTEVLERTGLLHDEAELMLRQSLADPTNHVAVLRAIASGRTRNNEISQQTRLEPAHVGKVLYSLEQLGLVAHQRPVTASPRAKKLAYRISDQFLRFHYRFIEPARTELRTNDLAAAYLERSILPQLDHHASLAWEDICREHVLLGGYDVRSVGRWWGQVPTGRARKTEEREIDVVAVDSDGTPGVVGMCKWTTNEVDFDELNLLDRLAQHIPGYDGSATRCLFSRSGFSDRLRAFAASDPTVELITPTDIYA